MIHRFFPVVALAALSFSACSGSIWNADYIPPTGYAYHDSTPLSTPHGYHQTSRAETEYRRTRAANEAAWRDAAAAIIAPVISALVTREPVAVTPDNLEDKIEAVASVYISDTLRTQDFLITLPKDARQKIVVRVDRDSDHPDMFKVRVTAVRGEKEVAHHTERVFVPYQNTITWED